MIVGIRIGYGMCKGLPSMAASESRGAIRHITFRDL